MFICGICQTVTAPKIKANSFVVEARPVEYSNIRVTLDEYEREHKELVTSRGFEIVREVKQCPPCAGLPEATTGQKHKIRAGNLFEEKLPAPLVNPLINVLIYNSLERAEKHNTKRAAADANVATPTIKGFVDRNTDFKF